MKKYRYELYCVMEQVFSDTSDNFSLFVESSAPIRMYYKDEELSGKVLKTQRKLERLLKDELECCGDRYHIVGITDNITGDLDDIEFIDLDEKGWK